MDDLGRLDSTELYARWIAGSDDGFLYIAIGVNYRTLAFRSNIPSQQADLYSQALDSFDKAATINAQLGIAAAEEVRRQGQALTREQACALIPGTGPRCSSADPEDGHG